MGKFNIFSKIVQLIWKVFCFVAIIVIGRENLWDLLETQSLIETINNLAKIVHSWQVDLC